MILDARGKPAPNSEIVKRLAQIDPRLHLQFCNDWWALAYRWKPDDPRHAMIRNGDMHPEDDWDMMTQLPLDCTADEAYGYVVRTLQTQARQSPSAKALLERVHAYNQAVKDDVMKDVYDYADGVFSEVYVTKRQR